MATVDRDTRRLIRRNIRDPERRQRYVDSLLRHQIYALRIGGASTQEALRRIAKVDIEVARRIARLVEGKRPAPFEIERLVNRLVGYNKAQLTAALGVLREDWLDWAEYSLERHATELAAFGIALRPAARDAPRKIVRAALAHRMQGADAASVEEIIQRSTATHSEAVGAVVRRAWQEGETVAQAKRSFDVLKIRRDAWVESAVRTSMLSVSNRAREAQLIENRDIAPRVLWVSTLDHRTSAICQSLDGKTFAQGRGPRPPAHVQCRSVVVPLLAGETTEDAIGVRPSTQAGPSFRYKGRESQAALQRRLKLDRGVRKGRKGDDRFTRKPIQDATYQEFLRRQPAAFQDFVLGPTRGRLFRSGKIRFDRFFDQRGNRIPVKELQAQIQRLES